ncbi:MAG: hypothetical protein R3229_03850 [Alphaproteobacteria bacterium]|nr:hypothetical protein [Alphaproteobacteria bacterium]
MAGLKTLVVLMGILIIVGATVVVTTIVQRGGMLAEAPARGAIALPAGAKVVETRIDGDRVLLRIRLAGGAERILVNDAKTGRPLAVHDIVREGPGR